MPRTPLASTLTLTMLAVLGGAPLTAQIFPSYPWPGSQQPQQQPQQQQGSQWNQGSAGQGQGPGGTNVPIYDPRSVRPQSLEPLPGMQSADPSGLFPTWVRPESYQGFPVFPPSLGGYGNNPAVGGGLMLPTGAGQLPPPALPTAPDWPAWVRAKRPVTLPYEPETVVLVRHAERVWFKVPTEDAFIPLYHYDNARGLPVGSEIQVRKTGEFLLLVYGGTRFTSFGTAALRVDKLEETAAIVTLSDFTWMDLAVANQGLICKLPDGSELEMAAPAAPIEDVGLGEARIRLERRIEPGDYSGRATIFNHGSRDVTWHTVSGDVALQPGHRVTFFLSPSTGNLAGELKEDAAAALTAGTSRIWEATESGAVTWSGARFDLTNGARLCLDPLLGDPFGKKSPVLSPPTPDR